ncbi:SDR family NAD(P)-dependent oxidoreductase [Rhizohabitans arisaemae]|uniref:SDR family NAD(P)-dependent oxidoreductase n=1 Tax=Rhizohabitans arisaemae TaxID=2720610 RepID=UPI0024B0F075|nr:SDR family oxidoreductase [Rhizohabitans arisaemae]
MRDLVVVVAGAGGPAGRAVVRRLHEAGATVLAVDAHEERALRSAEGLAGVRPVVVDLLDAEAVRAFARETEERYGHVDGLIHLVGGWRGSKTFAETSLRDWATLADLLICTLQHTTLAFAQALARSSRSRFAIVSAKAAESPTQGNAAYATAKAASEAWARAFADSLTGTGAAASVLVVKALVDDEMRAAKPDAKFEGFTDVRDLADAVAGLWDRPAEEINGRRLDLTA